MSIQIHTVTKTGQITQNLETLDFLKRRVWRVGEVSGESAREVIMQLDYLASLSNEPITLYINSGGGEVAAGFAVVDAIEACPCPVHTVAMGLAASAAALIFAAGDKRSIMAQAEIILHQPWSSLCQASASDFERVTGHITQIKKRCVSLLSRTTGRPSLLVERDLAEEVFLTSDGAVNYGIADEILMKKEKKHENDL